MAGMAVDGLGDVAMGVLGRSIVKVSEQGILGRAPATLPDQDQFAF